MEWYQIAGCVGAALGAVTAAPGVFKLITRPSTWRMPATLSESGTWSSLLLLFSGLAAATETLWPWIVIITLLAAYFVVPVLSRVRQRRHRAEKNAEGT
jgi:hypothetical protein